MRILDSRVQLSGRSDEKVEFYRRARLSAWNRQVRIDAEVETRSESASSARDSDDTVSLTQEALRAMGRVPAATARIAAPAPNTDYIVDFRVMDAKLRVQMLLIEQLTGRKVFRDMGAAVAEARAQAERDAGEAAHRASSPSQDRQLGWGVALDIHEEVRETRSASFEAQGVVRTADGREIAFSASLEMSDTRVTVRDFSLRAGDPPMTDPLVINFDGTAAELTEEKMDFDLDADGAAESISFVRAGSGFLVLDRNGDGVVNDGREMFGPTTGDGFAELAAHDDDSNGWIDEADAVYSQLGVWTREGDADRVRSLQEANVGAIYLDSAATSFRLEDASGAAQGQVQSTGVYLTEDGGVGTVQHVDLVT